MNKNKKKCYVLYISGVEAFKNYKAPKVEIIETEKLTSEQMENIMDDKWVSIKKKYNKKIWKILKDRFTKQSGIKLDGIFIDSSVAKMSFELFDKNQNLHTFKVHTANSILDFKEFGKNDDLKTRNRKFAPLFFMESFTGPGLYSKRHTMCNSQFENIWNVARGFGNMLAEANGGVDNALDKMSCKGIKEEEKDIPHYKFKISTSPDFNRDSIVYDDTEKKDLNVSPEVPKDNQYWNIYRYRGLEKEGEPPVFIICNPSPYNNLSEAINNVMPLANNYNSIIVITEDEDNENIVWAVVYKDGMSKSPPGVRVNSISDVASLMTKPLDKHIIITPIPIWSKLHSFKNAYAGVDIASPVESENSNTTNEAKELVLIIRPKAEDNVEIICKTKSELETDELLSNYKTKFINPETVLFSLIKNYLQAMNFNLTDKQITDITKIYVPAYAVGLHYMIREDNLPESKGYMKFIFSYIQQSYNDLCNTEAKYIGFYDFEEETK